MTKLCWTLEARVCVLQTRKTCSLPLWSLPSFPAAVSNSASQKWAATCLINFTVEPAFCTGCALTCLCFLALLSPLPPPNTIHLRALIQMTWRRTSSLAYGNISCPPGWDIESEKVLGNTLFYISRKWGSEFTRLEASMYHFKIGICCCMWEAVDWTFIVDALHRSCL